MSEQDTILRDFSPDSYLPSVARFAAFPNFKRSEEREDLWVLEGNLQQTLGLNFGVEEVKIEYFAPHRISILDFYSKDRVERWKIDEEHNKNRVSYRGFEINIPQTFFNRALGSYEISERYPIMGKQLLYVNVPLVEDPEREKCLSDLDALREQEKYIQIQDINFERFRPLYGLAGFPNLYRALETLVNMSVALTRLQNK